MSPTKAAREQREHGSGTIEKRGEGKWLVRVSYGFVGGRRIREAVTVTGTKADAKKALRRLVGAKDSAQGPKQVRSKATLGEWLDHFTATDPKASEATRRRMAQSVRLYTSDRLRACRLREVTPAFLTEELEKLRQRTSARTGGKLAGRTVGIWFAIVRAALSYAVEQRALTMNPALALGRPDDETESPEARWLTEGQVKTLLAAAASDAPELYGYFRLLAETGMRPAEGAALRWADVDLKGRRVTIRSAVVRLNDGWAVVPQTKTHAVGTISVSPATVRALEQHRARQAMLKLKHGARYSDQGLVFANELGQLYIPSTLSKRFRDLADGANLPRECTLYSLRHSAATHRLHRKQDPVSVAKLLRHKSTALVYKTYGHAIPDEKQAQLTDTLGVSYGDHATTG